MNEKLAHIIYAVLSMLFGICVFCGAMLLTGCRTTRVDSSVLEYQKQVDRLEEELRNRDRTVESAIRELAAITARSERMEGDIDTVILLFDEYQRAIDRLLQCYPAAGQ